MGAITRSLRTAILAGLFICTAGPAWGQTLIDGGTARANVRSGAVRERAPGLRVNDGIFRHLAFPPQTEITEPAPDEDAARIFLLTESIEILFDQLNEAISLFRNLLLARAGRPPVTSTAGLKVETDEIMPNDQPGSLVKRGLYRTDSSPGFTPTDSSPGFTPTDSSPGFTPTAPPHPKR